MSQTCAVQEFKTSRVLEVKVGEDSTDPATVALAPPRAEGPLLVVVWGGKGGIGKTDTAFKTAYSLGQIGPTLAVNGDKRQTDGGLDQLYAALQKAGEDPTFDYVESDDPSEYKDLRKLTQFRYIVIDGAPERDRSKLEAAAENADLNVVPMVPKPLEITGVQSSIREILRPLGARYRVLLTMVENSKRGSARNLIATMNAIGMPVFDTFMRYYVAHQDSGATGVPLVRGDGPNWNKARADVYGYLDQLLAELGEPYKAVRHPADRDGDTQ